MVGKVTRTAEERFWDKVQRTDSCWEWTGAKTVRGYGMFRFGDGNAMAHRAAYEMFVGRIPDGLVLDHLCRNPSCVNPSHLEPVTQSVNVLRGDSPETIKAMRAAVTHCRKAGHPLSGDNLYTDGRGRRTCRACEKINNTARARRRRDRLRSAA